MLLLQRCQRIEVVERRSAWDVLEVAVLQDTERHRAGTLTREETGEVVSLQACKACPTGGDMLGILFTADASNGPRREELTWTDRLRGHSRGGGRRSTEL